MGSVRRRKVSFQTVSQGGMASTGLARRCRGIFQTQASLAQNGKRSPKVVLFQISEIVSRWQSSVAPQHLDSSRLVVEQAGLADMKPKPPVDQLAFGKVFTDHMLTIDPSTQHWGYPSRSYKKINYRAHSDMARPPGIREEDHNGGSDEGSGGRSSSRNVWFWDSSCGEPGRRTPLWGVTTQDSYTRGWTSGEDYGGNVRYLLW